MNPMQVERAVDMIRAQLMECTLQDDRNGDHVAALTELIRGYVERIAAAPRPSTTPAAFRSDATRTASSRPRRLSLPAGRAGCRVIPVRAPPPRRVRPWRRAFNRARRPSLCLVIDARLREDGSRARCIIPPSRKRKSTPKFERPSRALGITRMPCMQPASALCGRGTTRRAMRHSIQR